MKLRHDLISQTDAWYCHPGNDDDVVVSTRVRLARNLANFPFPLKSSSDERERIQSLVFDAFSRLSEPERFQALSLERLDEMGRMVLCERCLLPESAASYAGNEALNAEGEIPNALVVRNDGRLVCQINRRDHLRLIGFAAGLAAQSVWTMCEELDLALQEFLQFAASYDFGFLTSSLEDSGSGMKLSARMHLPALAACGKMGHEVERLNARGLRTQACYGSASVKGGALGAYYEIETAHSCSYTEFDQIASFTAAIMQLAELERKTRSEYQHTYPTVLKDGIYQAFARLKFSRFISCEDAIVLLSQVAWGMDSGLLSGIASEEIGALLFRVRDAHIRFMDKAGSFSYEQDIADEIELRAKRLRCLVLQEALEDVRLAG